MNNNIIKDMKKSILLASYFSQEGHIASSFSALDILWVLYDKIMSVNDKLILSKGHASLALYAVLKEKGYITTECFLSFCQFNSELGGHPKRDITKGILASTGSLGHGLPIAVGLALAEKINKTSNKVYCILGDQEVQEGTTWESIILASHHKLNNLYCIIDNNHSSNNSIDNSYAIQKMFNGFDCDVQEICGHNHFDIYNALNNKSHKPNVLICHTIKGFGCKSMENNPEWHHKSPSTQDELEKLIGEIYI